MHEPSESLLKKYADVLVKFALNSGRGINEGDVVVAYVPDVAKPLLIQIHKSILEAGGSPIIRMIPTGINRQTYELSNDEQLTFYPAKYHKALVNMMDHQIGILADTDLHELEGVDPAKIMKSLDSSRKTRELIEDKEYKGKFTWTLGLYPTKAMADEAGLTLEQYWQQVIKACFLDKKDPISEWKAIMQEQIRVKTKLDSLKIQYVQVKGKNINLKVKIGSDRKWLGGGGRNIPSFEIFTSPDWRETEGYIYFNQPLYMYGSKIRDIRLEFKGGKVVRAEASRNENLLVDMIKRKNADKIGEFSLTDKRASRITKFMANTLYDENIGGRYGNMHVALGLAYKEAYIGDIAKMKKNDWKKVGFNQSAEHKDIITTEDRTVTAVLGGGKTKVIYKDGEFVV